MFARALTVVFALSAIASAQECQPDRDLRIHADVTVSTPLNWTCDTWIDDGVTVTIVAGGSVSGSPWFEGDSNLVMSGGSIEALSTQSGYPYATITGGQSQNLILANLDHQSLISGGSHDIVAAANLLIAGGEIARLVPDFVYWTGGEILAVDRPGTIVVRGTGLKFSARRLTGTLDDGTILNRVYPEGNFILSDAAKPAGDANGNGLVGLEDLNGARNSFGAVGYSPFDVNFDARVDLADVNLIRNNFGEAGSSSVPEPATIAIAAICLVIFCLRHR